MLGSEVLEVAIGVMFVYLLVSMLCTAMREGVEGWLKTRAAYLEHGLRELLQDSEGTGIVASIYNHPLIFGLFRDAYTARSSAKLSGVLASGQNLPSYIPSQNFALALMDIAARGPTDSGNNTANAPIISLDTIRTNAAQLQNPAVQRVLLTALDTAQGDLNKAQANIEAWYDSGMDRVSGWYKRSTQWILFAMGLFIAVAMNINTIRIADYLYRNDVARAAVVATAGKAAGDTGFLSHSYSDVQANLASMALPIGWGSPNQSHGSSGESDKSGLDYWNSLCAPILGWLMTALAATLGAPFWFDMLNKVVLMRSTLKPPEKSAKASSEDRRLAPKQADAQPLQGQPNLADTDNGVDGCDVAVASATADKDLPAATGGVAQ